MANKEEKVDKQSQNIRLVVIDPVVAEISAAGWQKALGAAIALPGGAEVQVRNDVAGKIRDMMEAGDWGLLSDDLLKSRVSIFIDDPYYPPIEVHLSMREILTKFQETKTDGPRKMFRRRRCVHEEHRPAPGCEYCFYRQWKVAKELMEKNEGTI